MSKETHEWLSENVLIGFTEKRGKAWHYREGDGNHYTGPVPVADVMKRLFYWTPEERPLYLPVAAEGATEDVSYVQVPNQKAIVHPETDHVFGIFKDGYNPHPFGQWLVENVSNVLGTLEIASAGLLKSGAVAWVQAEMPDNVVTVDGVEFRPFFNAFSSLDGTFASTYKTGVTNVVCDNTMRAAQNEDTPQVKIKSTKNAKFQGQKVRDALGIVHAVADDFSAMVHELCSQNFTDVQFGKLVDVLAPEADHDAKPRAVTIRQNKRDAFWDMWRQDERVAPWNGTAWGAYQAVNTYGQHVQTVKGSANRAERNMLNSLAGDIDKADARTLELIGSL